MPDDSSPHRFSQASSADDAAGDAAGAPEEPGPAPGAAGPEAPHEQGPHRNVPEREAANGEAERTRRRLLAPLGSLYALAQTLAESEPEARRLVETTYKRAAEVLAAGQGPDASDARPWLFALLVATARSDSRGAASPAPADTGDAARSSRHFRRRAQERFLRRALPPAFATLAPAQRLLLTLHDVEQLDLPSAAAVTDLSENNAQKQLAQARADLREALRQMAPRPERPFLEDEALSDAHLQEALRQMAERDLITPPPALRPAARRALNRQRTTASQAPSAPVTEAPPGAADSSSAPPTPARDQARTPASWRARLPRFAAAFFLIAVAGGVAYLATTMLDRPAETSLAALSAQQAASVDARLRTDRSEQAEQFVRDELGRRLQVPQIRGAALRGVGIAEVVPGERVPVFLFRDSASGRPVTTYAYDYALLDRASDRLRLDSALRQRLAQEGRFAAQDVEDHRVLLWRRRDDIFAAVTSSRADSLQQRIAF